MLKIETVVEKYNGEDTEVVIPEGVTRIGWYAFLGCSSLTSVVIPEGVTKIGDRAFYNCNSLMSVVIPESVTKIGDLAFAECPVLTIHAPKGSKAEAYAKKNGIQFNELS